jgi:hypothetical protein
VWSSGSGGVNGAYPIILEDGNANVYYRNGVGEFSGRAELGLADRLPHIGVSLDSGNRVARLPGSARAALISRMQILTLRQEK